ncbi:MAG: transposase [Candidatus Zixiibacteriota bacterium]
MGLRFKDQNLGQCFFVTTTFKNHQAFGKNSEFLTSIANSLDFCANKYQGKIAAYCLMPTHIHLLIFIEGNKLSSFMRDFKKFTAQKVSRDYGFLTDSLWMPRYDRVAIFSEEVFYKKLEYIHNNPIKANLVENAADWAWSSAGDYLSSGTGIIPVWKDW